MSKKYTQEEFLEKLTEKNLQYREGKFKVTGEYKTVNTKILVENIFGECMIKPNSLLSNRYPNILSATNRDEYFIKQAKEIHGDRYTYTKVTYTRAKDNVIITCRKHGDFIQKPDNHLSGRGCKLCTQSNEGLKSNLKEFIKKANEVHDNFYSYPEQKYENARTKLTIVCDIHGEFRQVPDSHLRGGGCPKCGTQLSCWSKTEWKITGEKSKYFDSFKVYIIKCWNENEEFYKIGRTFKKVKERFYKSNLHYEYKIIKIIEGTADEVYDLENKLQKHNKKYSYIPTISFSGMYECFKHIDL